VSLVKLPDPSKTIYVKCIALYLAFIQHLAEASTAIAICIPDSHYLLSFK